MVITLSGIEGFLLQLAAVSVALGVIWRMWVKPAQLRVLQAFNEHTKMVDLVTTEFQVDGGATLKDAVNALVVGQRRILDWIEQHEERFGEGHDRRL